ncbi:MAG: hypothetical protein ACRD6W_02955, partial [Nitrososphaerales archaeon]
LADPDRYYELDQPGEARYPRDIGIFVPTSPEDLAVHRKSTYWTLVLFLLAHELLNQSVIPPGYPVDVAVGYLDPQEELDAFGVAISIDSEDIPYAVLPPEPTPFYSLPLVRDRSVRVPRLEGWPDEYGPMVVRRPREYVELHAPPSGFAGASAASYVRNAQTGSPLGLLGCRHVLPLAKVGAGVPIAGHPSQKVAAISDELDLAVVSSPTLVPSTPRLAQRWPAQWLPCEIEGNVSTVKTRIAQIANQWGVFSDPLLPVHVDLEASGQHGDSGAAVLDRSSATTRGVLGVYVGAINNQGPTKGRSVHIQQIEKVMNLELVG